VLTEFFRRITGRPNLSESSIRMAGIYRRQGKDYVTASSRTRDGFWLEEGPVDVLDAGDSAALAQAVRSALARSTHGIRAPKDWSSHVNRVVEAAGLKRYSAFAKETDLVTVEEKDGLLRILPYRNGGSREGYLGQEDKAIDLPSGTSGLAEAIETAFQHRS
jgi:hypothetical protein